jgi:hypothetical protein
MDQAGSEGDQGGQGEELSYRYPPTVEEEGEEKQCTYGYQGDDKGDMLADHDPCDEGESKGEKGCSETFLPRGDHYRTLKKRGLLR